MPIAMVIIAGNVFFGCKFTNYLFKNNLFVEIYHRKIGCYGKMM